MARRFIDLHTHSIASDGSDPPEVVVRTAAAQKLAAVALTDHDTLSGIAAAREEAERVGIDFVPGIEIAVQDEEGELHLLGLWMPEPSQRMREALDLLQHNRRKRNQAMLDVLAEQGMPMSMDEVRACSGGEAVGRPHIALAMLARKYVATRREAFERYLGWGARAFVARELLTPEQGIALLRDEGATVAVAHPCLSPAMTPERLDDTLSDFRAKGLSAIEAYHSVHTPAQVRLCVDLAARHNLLLTGGSDYHGRNKEGIRLGSGSGGLRVPLLALDRLRAFRKSQGLWV